MSIFHDLNYNKFNGGSHQKLTFKNSSTLIYLIYLPSFLPVVCAYPLVKSDFSPVTDPVQNWVSIGFSEAYAAEGAQNRQEPIANEQKTSISVHQPAPRTKVAPAPKAKTVEPNKSGTGASQDQRLQCDHCESSFIRKKDLNKHMRKKHLEVWKARELPKEEA